MKNFKPQVRKSKSGTDITIRAARNNDAKALLDLALAIVTEDAYQLLTLPELQLTVDSEEEWIGSYYSTPNRIILVAEEKGILVGELDFCNGHRNRIAHTGEFGMSVRSSHRGQGIGALLVRGLIKWATSHSTIEKLGLNVHSTNTPAIGLYKKMGFEIEGIKKNELKYADGHYVDTIIMGRFVLGAKK